MSFLEASVPAKKTEYAVAPKEQPNILSSAEIEKWLFEPNDMTANYCCMIYGADGTGKTGIALDFLNDADAKAGKKIIVIDLDGGNLPLIAKYHKDKINNIIVKNPLELKIANGDITTDYKLTLARIKAVVNWVAENYRKHKIKAVVFDGLSTALKFAENQMRVEKHLTVEGGVNMAYWKIREKLFLDIISAIKSLPLSKFFIAHEDFIKREDDDKFAAVKAKTNAEMHQKIRCIRDDATNVKFKAIIDKSKFKVGSEGKVIEFCIVDKETEKAKWNTNEIFKALI